jgi:hypothetical protein
MTRYYKKVAHPDGSITVYEYNKDSSAYWQNTKQKHNGVPKIECFTCGKMVKPYYLKRHQTRPSCLANKQTEEIKDKTYWKVFYDKHGKLEPKVKCDVCNRDVKPSYLEKHKLKPCCVPVSNSN